MKTTILILLSGIFLTSCSTQPQEDKKVELPTSMVHEIESQYVPNMTYDIFIDLPPGYNSSNNTYPVVYLLDAYETYGLMLQTYQQLIYGLIPEMIIVGISYQIDGEFYSDGLKEYFDTRARDYLPTFLSREEIAEKHGRGFANYVRYSGGGDNFLVFIEKELIPYIESEYRADPQRRGLFGYSLGGTFTSYCLFSKPRLFKDYFIGSPMLLWDDKVIFTFDNTDKLIGTTDTINVYTCWGEFEPEHRSLFRDYLEDKNNPNIRITSEVLQGETHLSGLGRAYSRAFRTFYEK